jgi:hypothetical protein
MGLIHVPGILLPDSAVEAYVVPDDLRTNRVNFSFISLASVPRQVKVWIVPSGGSAGNSNLVIGMESAATKLLSGEPRPYPMSQVLSPGDKIFWEADVADEVVAHLDISEVPAAGVTVDPVTGKPLPFTIVSSHNDSNTGYLPDTLSLAYTVPDSVPAAQVMSMELLVHNLSSDREAFTMSAVPPNETPGDLQWIISSNTQQWHLAPGETRLVQFEHFLTAGYQVHWRSLNTDVIVGRLSVEEVRF